MIERMLGYDKDEDGRINKSEMPEHGCKTMFDRVDSNGDEYLDQAELETMATRMGGRGGDGSRGGARRGGRGGQGGGGGGRGGAGGQGGAGGRSGAGRRGGQGGGG